MSGTNANQLSGNNQKVTQGGRWNSEGRQAVLKAFDEKGHLAAIEEMLKMNEIYGDSCFMNGDIKMIRYIKLGQNEKALDVLEEGYKMRFSGMPYASPRYSFCYQLKDEPRYREVMMKMKLPIGTDSK